MTGRTRIGPISEADFAYVLDALTASQKGRAFLAEYQRRARPEETVSLLDSLGRIEATMGTIRDSLQPERIAGELRRVAGTLEVAMEGAAADAAGEEAAGRLALVAHARRELIALAASLVAEAETDPGA